MSQTTTEASKQPHAIFTVGGYIATARTRKVREYESPRQHHIVYLNVERTQIPWTVVVCPSLPLDRIPVMPGVEMDEGWYHHSNLRQFPKRLNAGKAPIHYGKRLRVSNVEALSSVLYELDRIRCPDDCRSGSSD